MNTENKGKKKPHFVSEERIFRQYERCNKCQAKSCTLWVMTLQMYIFFVYKKNLNNNTALFRVAF